MASIKNLKKELNYTMSDVIENCYTWQLEQQDKKQSAKAEKIIDEAILAFDTLNAKIKEKNVSDKKKHFRAIKEAMHTQAAALNEKIAKL